MKKIFFSSLLVLLTLVGIVPCLAAQSVVRACVNESMHYAVDVSDYNPTDIEVTSTYFSLPAGVTATLADNQIIIDGKPSKSGVFNGRITLNMSDGSSTIIPVGQVVVGTSEAPQFDSAVTVKYNQSVILGDKNGIASMAEGVIGCGYVSGMAGPKVFDNKGLVYFSFKSAGTTIPRLMPDMAIEMSENFPTEKVQMSYVNALGQFPNRVEPGDLLIHTIDNWEAQTNLSIISNRLNEEDHYIGIYQPSTWVADYSIAGENTNITSPEVVVVHTGVAAAGNIYQWYVSADAEEPIHIGPTFTLSRITQETTIYVGNWCVDDTRQAIHITIEASDDTPKYRILAMADVNGTTNGTGFYEKNTTATLTATANTGYSFDKWSDGNTDNPRTITVTENVTLTATFKQDAPTQLSETNAETKVEKVLRNGQVLIIRNGNTYDLTGRKTESGK